MNLILGLFLIIACQAAWAEQCVPYARSRSGIQLSGNAYTWWAQAKSKGSIPHPGSVLSMPQQGSGAIKDYGHVAYVVKIVNQSEIIVDHANWDGNETRHLGVRVRDVSGNWKSVNIESAPGAGFGATAYTVNGFVYPIGMTQSTPNCNVSSSKCSIRSPSNSSIGWFPPVDDCRQASQWYNMATISGERQAVGSTTAAFCPEVCYAN